MKSTTIMERRAGRARETTTIMEKRRRVGATTIE